LISQTKQEDGTDTSGDIDGTPTIELIERIQAIRDKANEAAGQ
jgi:hypothetical protein